MTPTIEEVRAILSAELTLKLEGFLRQQADARASKEFRIGAWNVGSCPRKNWLLLNGAYQEALQPRSLMVFDLGNRVEDAVIEYLISCGVPLIRTNESKDTIDFPPIGRIRPDAYIELGGVQIVADVKSMSEKSYAKAVRGDIDFAYRGQLECYMRALDVRFGVLLLYQKNTSHFDFTSCVYGQDDAVWQRVLECHALATGKGIPGQPYKFDFECSGVSDGRCIGGKTPGRGQPHKNCGGTGLEPGGPFLRYPCTYCPVKDACWKQAGYEIVPFLEEKEAPRWAVRPVGAQTW